MNAAPCMPRAGGCTDAASLPGHSAACLCQYLHAPLPAAAAAARSARCCLCARATRRPTYPPFPPPPPAFPSTPTPPPFPPPFPPPPPTFPSIHPHPPTQPTPPTPSVLSETTPPPPPPPELPLPCPCPNRTVSCRRVLGTPARSVISASSALSPQPGLFCPLAEPPLPGFIRPDSSAPGRSPCRTGTLRHLRLMLCLAFAPICGTLTPPTEPAGCRLSPPPPPIPCRAGAPPRCLLPAPPAARRACRHPVVVRDYPPLVTICYLAGFMGCRPVEFWGRRIASRVAFRSVCLKPH